ncbi:hypothetical protein ACFFHI_31085, partial [Streptomyces palmae]
MSFGTDFIGTSEDSVNAGYTECVEILGGFHAAHLEESIRKSVAQSADAGEPPFRSELVHIAPGRVLWRLRMAGVAHRAEEATEFGAWLIAQRAADLYRAASPAPVEADRRFDDGGPAEAAASFVIHRQPGRTTDLAEGHESAARHAAAPSYTVPPAIVAAYLHRLTGATTVELGIRAAQGRTGALTVSMRVNAHDTLGDLIARVAQACQDAADPSTADRAGEPTITVRRPADAPADRSTTAQIRFLHFARTAVAAEPDTAITDLELAVPQAFSVPKLFERRVAESPDAAALIAGELRLSYAELDARANRLARVL